MASTKVKKEEIKKELEDDEEDFDVPPPLLEREEACEGQDESDAESRKKLQSDESEEGEAAPVLMPKPSTNEETSDDGPADMSSFNIAMALNEIVKTTSPLTRSSLPSSASAIKRKKETEGTRYNPLATSPVSNIKPPGARITRSAQRTSMPIVNSPKPINSLASMTRKKPGLTSIRADSLRPIMKLDTPAQRLQAARNYSLQNEANSISRLLQKQKPIRVDVAVGNAGTSGESTSGPNSDDIEDRARHALKEQVVGNHLLDGVLQTASSHNLLLGCMLINGLTNVQSQSAVKHQEFTADLFALLTKYEVS